ncbi:MAG: DUF3089 domain-containing protein [Allosphingosinicella sp.]|uniref:DUF3089 domain-containing protein n=1 Tax=Allosphingosinicella sp. TaxID=2823234 RepID=UPI00394962A8
MKLKWIAAAAALVIGAAAPAQPAQTEAAAPDYADPATWLCLPGRADACGQPLPTTALNPNGYGSVGLSAIARDPVADCFYVYPTVSRDETLHSDLNPGVEEQAAAAVQFARFAGVCRTFAPVYRQFTLSALRRAMMGENIDRAGGIAYEDVRAAWRHYLANHNQGRPFVLIGHSQGTIHLTRLLAEEIEGTEAHQRLLSAMLIGYNVEVPEGRDVGGSLQRTPLCTRPGQTGCVVSYVSFRATNPPPPGALFGRAANPGMTVACTNPALLAKGRPELDSYWFTAAPPTPGGPPPVAWSSQGAPPTPFVRTEGLASAACVNRGQTGYLSVLVHADPADARTDDIPGDVVVAGQLQPGWGLHLGDVNLALGDLVAIVERQSEAWRRRR